MDVFIKLNFMHYCCCTICCFFNILACKGPCMKKDDILILLCTQKISVVLNTGEIPESTMCAEQTDARELQEQIDKAMPQTNVRYLYFLKY